MSQNELEHSAVYRQKKIVEILQLLHQGGSFDEAKAIFDQTFASVDVSEITSAERALIATGLNPMEIQHLCNVHAAVFKGKISDNHVVDPVQEQPGHPVQVMKLENLIITSLLKDELLPCLKKWQQSGTDAQYLTRIRRALKDLITIDKHYARKENTIFPLMDKYGITAPPKVMWGVDDKIRGLIATANDMVNRVPLPDKYEIEAAIEQVNTEVMEMIFKEEQIMLPMVDEVFTAADWGLIASESDDIGYTLIAQPLPWRPSTADLEKDANTPKKVPAIAAELNEAAKALAEQEDLARLNKRAGVKKGVTKSTGSEKISTISKPVQVEKPSQPGASMSVETPVIDDKIRAEKIAEFKAGMSSDSASTGRPEWTKVFSEQPKTAYERTKLALDANGLAEIHFNNGTLNLAELTGIFKILPLDLTFVDANDNVAWFSDDGHRIFPRTKAVVGRAVINCHPPKSYDKVKKILDDFHAGSRDQAEFWIDFRGIKAYIRYFAVHDEDGEYAGCLEVSQDITRIQQLEGERRLDSED